MTFAARLLLIACLFSAAAAAETELLLNPGFSGTEPWKLPPTATIGAVPGREDLGMLIDAPSVGWHMAQQWGVKIAPGRVRASVDVQVEATSGGSQSWEKPRLQLIFLTADWKEIDQPRPGTEASVGEGWKRLVIDATAPDGATMVVFCIGLHGCAGKATFAAPSLVQPAP